MADNDLIVSPAIAGRFWSKVDRTTSHECWNWRGRRDRHGYGLYTGLRSNTRFAHRIAFIITHNRIPPGVVRHSCDNPRCCNPDHLLEGTVQDNVSDRVKRRRSANGERNGRSKLTELTVREILRSKQSTVQLAREHGLAFKTVRDIRLGINWHHIWLEERQRSAA